MSTYQLISDSSCDIPFDELEKNHVGFVPFYVSFDTVNYHKEFLELTADDFYAKISDSSVFPKTSLPSASDYSDAFEPYLKEGKDILCLCLTSKFSGSYQSAMLAKDMLSETYPNQTIEIIDSYGATGSQGLLVLEAVRMRDAGHTLAELKLALEALKLTSKINFTVDSLEHLQKGGRIGKASALAGSLLNIKPIICLYDGELHPDKRVRGQKKALSTILDMTKKEIGNKKEEFQLVVVRAKGEMDSIADNLANEFRKEGFHVLDRLWTIGITIGTHAGPTAVGVCYIKKHEYL